MKYIALILLAISVNAHASTIDCYAGAKNVYHGEPTSIVGNKDYIIAAYEDYSDVIFLNRKNSAQLCVVKQIDK